MVEIEDIIPANEKTDTAVASKPYDKLQWAQGKQQERQAVYSLIDKVAMAVGRDSHMCRTYLDVQSRFNLYSIGNALIITDQSPKATVLKDFDAWKEAGTPVKKNEKSMMILEPGEKYSREDGSVGTSMNIKHVFDISQTSAELQQVKIEQPDERVLLKALISKAPVSIEATDEIETSENIKNAYYDHDHEIIYVKRNLDTPELFRALSKELALADFAAQAPEYSRSTKHFKALCVSYILCNKFGIDTKDMEIRVPATYSTKEAQDIRADLTEIRAEAVDMISRMSKSLEQQKAPKSKEQER